MIPHFEFIPDPGLLPDVKCMWVLEESQSIYNRDNAIPDAYTELVINCGAPMTLIQENGDTIPMPLIFLNRVQHTPIQFHVSGECQLLALCLFPWALNNNGTPIAGTSIIRLEDHWNRFALSLRQRYHANGHRAALGDFQQFYREHSTGIATSSSALLQNAGHLIFAAEGQMRMTHLAEKVHFSSSQVERVFQQQLGITPKLFSRLVRFRAICNRMMVNPNQAPGDLAQQFGYTDQSHFIHDFKVFAARTPTEFAGRAKRMRSRWRNAEYLQYD